MTQNILWIAIILLAATSQWYIIEVKFRNPNKLFWFSLRIIAFAGFLWWYMVDGFKWYWAGPYMVFTFAWLFPLFLNIFRPDKPVGYMANTGWDGLIKRTIGIQIYFYLGFVLMLIAVLLQLVYGQLTFHEATYINF